MAKIDELIDRKRSESLMARGALALGDVRDAEKRASLATSATRAEGAFNLLSNLRAAGAQIVAHEGPLPADSLHEQFERQIAERRDKATQLDEIEKNQGGLDLLAALRADGLTLGMPVATDAGEGGADGGETTQNSAG